jgi:hypothetical protein
MAPSWISSAQGQSDAQRANSGSTDQNESGCIVSPCVRWPVNAGGESSDRRMQAEGFSRPQG